MTLGAPPPQEPPERGVLASLTRAIAILGGLLSVAVALLVTVSVTSRKLGYGAIPGDFELVKMAVALAIFSFLPFTQARRGNIMVDTFTARLPPRVTRTIDAFWDLVYAGLIGVLAWTTFNGAREALSTGFGTMVLGLPQWPALGLSALLLALLALTALVTALRLLRPAP